MIQAVIYDFDGVVVQSLEMHLKAYLYALSRLGINATRQEVVEKCFNKIDSVAAGNFGITDIKSFSQYYLETVTEGCKHLTLYPHVISTIQALRESGILIGIGTLREKENLEYALEDLNLRNLFDAMIAQSIKRQEKAEIFREVCKKLDVQPMDVIVVGDAENDIIAAKDIGSVSILFYPQEHEEFYKLDDLQTHRPDFVIRDHRDIVSIVQKKGKK